MRTKITAWNGDKESTTVNFSYRNNESPFPWYILITIYSANNLICDTCARISKSMSIICCHYHVQTCNHYWYSHRLISLIDWERTLITNKSKKKKKKRIIESIFNKDTFQSHSVNVAAIWSSFIVIPQYARLQSFNVSVCTMAAVVNTNSKISNIIFRW